MKWKIVQTTNRVFDGSEQAPVYSAVLTLIADGSTTLADLQGFLSQIIGKNIPASAILGSNLEMPVRWS